MTRPDLTAYLDRVVKVIIDRPRGSRHPRHPGLVYPVNYGYVPSTLSGDGESVDAYVLGVDVPISEIDGLVIGVVLRRDDAEDKLVVAPEGRPYSAQEIRHGVAFQERYFESHVVVSGIVWRERTIEGCLKQIAGKPTRLTYSTLRAGRRAWISLPSTSAWLNLGLVVQTRQG